MKSHLNVSEAKYIFFKTLNKTLEPKKGGEGRFIIIE